ncbi:MAG: RluA family pseudouridine synthase [Nitrospirae bacterium]|nr:RluA family pseudouridine synthase [Nitrospirota bacterium]NTW66512.1 RluA family pseudouridine synthase [Nitrospirota bacterium]
MASHSIPLPTTNPRLNEGCEYREQLGPDANGRTLIDYLSRRYDHSSSAEWAMRIASGHVLIDDRPAYADDVLRRGCELVWQRQPWIEPDAPRSFGLLYEDDDLIAVNKPAGLPTLPGANFLQSTLLYLVRTHAPDAAPLHRLGRWTSGIVLCAKNQLARTELMHQWSAQKVGKRYRALASGCPAWNEIAISTPIGPVPHALLGSVHAATPKGKPSLSYVTVIERREDSFLCDVRIATGRPHQIRIHLASSGHPLVGDPLYGAGGLPLLDTRALPGDPGYHLHAAELGFHHPSTSHEVVIECEPPSLLMLSTGTH